MKPRQINVFFYGLFMDVKLLRAKGAEPSDIQPACAPGFALRIGQRATLIHEPQSSAYGMVMRLSHSEIEKLYSEASVSTYRPEAVLTLLADGSYIPALCFNLIEPPGADEVNLEYAMKLRELASDLKLPPEYIQSIY